MVDILTPKHSEITIRQEGVQVVVIKNGRALMDLHWDAALALARAIMTQARKAEEQAKAEDIAIDQAFLARAGIPFKITNRPDIMDRARVEAQHNSTLRKQLPGGVRAEPRIGVPAVIKEAPRGH